MIRRGPLVPSTLVVLLLGLLCCATSATAAEPELRQILPRGGQRGTEVSVRLYGNRLHDAEAILFHANRVHGGDEDPTDIEVTALKVVDGKKVDATLRIADDARLGEHSLRVRTRSGLSSFFTFWVGPYPTVREKEPNSLFDAPQPIELGVTVQGVVENEDVDYYEVQAKAGERITAEVEGIRLGDRMFDPHLAILDAQRFELAACDDSSLHVQDPVVGVVVPADGRYVVAVRSASYRGSNRHRYRLHVGRHARPTVVFPPGGPAGETVTVRMIGDPAGEYEATVVVPHDRPRRDRVGEVFVPDASGLMPPSGNAFRISDLPNVLEVEPNGNRKKPHVVEAAIPFALNGIIAEANDHDWYRVTLKKNVTYDFRVFARRLRSPLDPVFTIHNANGKYLAGNDDSGGPDSYQRWKAPADGEYLLRLRDHLRQGGEEYVYRIEARRSNPRVFATIPPVRRYRQDRQAIAIPRGNRFAALFRITRQNFGGPVTLDFGELPPGVTAHYEDIVAGQTQVPVVFEASADAELAGWTQSIVVRHADPKVDIEGTFFQSADFVRADPNNTIYYRGHVDSLAIAVAQPAPFRLTLEEPPVPLVRGGGMSLRVKAERAEGFDQEITLNVPHRPPGVGAARNVKIPAGKTEGRIWINANDGAQLRAWKIAVIGTAGAGGPLTTSTQLATLRVEDRFVVVRPEMTAVHRGNPTEVVCKLEIPQPFEGTARAELFGLPAHCKAEPIEFTKDATELVFPVTTGAKSPVGRHKTIFVRAFVPQAGTTVLHNSPGRAVFRIDPPPKVAKADTKPKPAPKPKPKAGKKEKRLSRLEKLRKEHADRKREESEPPSESTGEPTTDKPTDVATGNGGSR